MADKDKRVRILIANAQPLIRDGLMLILGQEPDFEVVGYTNKISEVADIVEQLKADVLIIDVLFEGEPSVCVLEEIKRRNISVRTLTMGMPENGRYMKDAINAGAAAYILKTSEKEKYICTIRAIYNNLMVFDEKTFEFAKDALGSNKVQYTIREEKIIQSIVDGMTNKEIASELNLTEGTIKNIVSGILVKSGATSRTQLVSMVLSERITKRGGELGREKGEKRIAGVVVFGNFLEACLIKGRFFALFSILYYPKTISRIRKLSSI